MMKPLTQNEVMVVSGGSREFYSPAYASYDSLYAMGISDPTRDTMMKIGDKGVALAGGALSYVSPWVGVPITVFSEEIGGALGAYMYKNPLAFIHAEAEIPGVNLSNYWVGNSFSVRRN